MSLSDFFLLWRPSCGKMKYSLLSKEEKDRFAYSLCEGVGEYFKWHCFHLMARRVIDKRSIDRNVNDIYDLLQFILVKGANCGFVTNDVEVRKNNLITHPIWSFEEFVSLHK
jgi:hypothetical protein